MMMSRYIYFSLLLTVALVSCSSQPDTSQKTTQPVPKDKVAVDSFPWPFSQDIDLQAEEGQNALSCYTFYHVAIGQGRELAQESLIFYNTTIVKCGNTKTTLADKVEMPNALVIPLPKKVKAAKGDILLTWWQSASGMQRAIVTDDELPFEPKVDYLDLDHSGQEANPGLAQQMSGEQLRPNTFAVLTSGEWQSGAPLAYGSRDQWSAATLIHEKDGRVLMLIDGNRLVACDKKDCRLIPFNVEYAAGESVWGAVEGHFSPGFRVTNYDKEKGRVWLEKDGQKYVLSVLHVTKTLN